MTAPPNEDPVILSEGRNAAGAEGPAVHSTASARRPRVFMMDLWATVPYYTVYLSRALIQQGARITVGSITYYLDPACFSSRGIKLRPGCLNLVGRFPLSRQPRRILKFAESLLNLAALTLRFLFRPPDIVHVQFLPLLTSRFPLDLWFVRFCRHRGARIVLTVHDLLPHDTGLAHRATFTSLYASVDAIICHSAPIRDRLVAEFAVPESKISVIPHGPFFYDLPPAPSDSVLRDFDLCPGKPLVLWQGIIFPYKGIDLLLNAWAQVEADNPDACLIIAGTGQPALLDAIRAQAARLNLQRVHLHFRFISTEELVALYRAAAIVTYPYRAITTSGALATGLALGKTIVATDLPVFRELLTNRQNALLVPPPNPAAPSTNLGAPGLASETWDRTPGAPPSTGDHHSGGDPQASDQATTTGLAAALTELIRTPALREQLAAQVRVMNFGDESWLSIARQTLAVYDSLV